MAESRDPAAPGDAAAAKPKRQLTPAQAEAFARGRATMMANRDAKRVAAQTAMQNGQELVLVDRSALRPKVEPAPVRAAEPLIGTAANPVVQMVEQEHRARSINDVVNRVREKHGEPPLPPPESTASQRRGNWRMQADLEREAAPTNGSYPSAEDVARDTEIYGTGGVIPPVEIDPRKRDRPTMGSVRSAATEDDEPSEPADVSSGKHRSLADLFASYPVGDGQYEIQVVRRAPNSWGGFQCKGIQRPIRQYLTDGDFIELYGGGEYTLTVVGPPRRGGVVDPQTNKIRPKALSEPIAYAVPQSYPPNPDACVFGDADDEDYQQENDMRHIPQVQIGRQPSGRPTTVADAKILETELTFEERRQLREQEREREQQREQQERERQLASQLQSLPASMEPLMKHALQSVQNQANENTSILRDQLQAERERADAERERAEARAAQAQKPSAEITLLTGTMGKMIESMIAKRPEEGLELQRLAGQFAQERETMQGAHQRELERISTSAEKQVRDATERADARIRDIELRCTDRETRAINDAERQVREAKEAATREKADIERMYTSRLTDETRNHDRELRAKDESWGGRLETQKTAFEMRIAQKDDELARLRSDSERYRTDAEKNANLPARMAEWHETAELMGYTKSDGAAEPMGWKEMLGQVGLQLVGKLPEIVQSAGDAVRGTKAQLTPEAQYAQMLAQSQQTAPQQMAGAPQHQFPPLPRRRNRMVFNTEGGPDFGENPIEGTGTYVAPQQQTPMTAPAGIAPAGLQAQPNPTWQPPPMPQQMMVPQPQMQFPPQPQQQMPQQFMQPPAPVQQQAQPATGGADVSAEQILALVKVFEQAYATDEPPAAFAQGLVQQIGAPMAKQLLAGLSVERVVATIQASPGGAASPLVRRDGQKFLRAVWQAAKAIT